VRYVIDSDIIIYQLAGIASAVSVLRQLGPDGIAISTITYMEVYQGLLRSPDPQLAHAQFNVFLTDVPLLPVSTEIAARCAELREALTRQGKRVRARALDLLIATTALEHDLTLVTRNTLDYADIPGLRVFQPPNLP
jgi:predicted nucleic acid-binding protein